MTDARASVPKPAAVARRPAAVARAAAAAVVRPQTAARSIQRRLGNQGTQALATQVIARANAQGSSNGGAISSGLTLSQPGDALEREADSMAERVMRMSGPASHAPAIQRQCKDCDSEEGLPKVQRKGAAGAESEVSESVANDIRALEGKGSPLPAAERSYFEPRFGADFSQVRVHTDAHAARTASSINAKAFTTGKDIAFGSGHYAPGTQAGRQLLAHELTHVVQQGGARTEPVGRMVWKAGFPGFAPAPDPKQPAPATYMLAFAEVVELKGHRTFDPSKALAEVLEYESPTRGVPVQVRFGNLAYGRIIIRKHASGYFSTEDPALIDLTHPAFPGKGRFARPRLQLSITDSNVFGFVNFFPWDLLPAAARDKWSQQYGFQDVLGWKGLDRIKLSYVRNGISNGILHYSLVFDYRLDGEWEGKGSFSVVDEAVDFDAQTDIKVPGVADTKMPLSWVGGKVFGATKLNITLAPKDVFGGVFSGSLEGTFANGTTNITGEASYRSKKFNGTVTIRVAPIQEAFAQISEHILPQYGPYKFTTGPDTKHAVFGWGVLDFHYNEWLSGRASVVVDHLGYITSFGYIRPTKDFQFLTDDTLSGIQELFDESASSFTRVWFTTGLTGKVRGRLTAAGRVGPLTMHDLEVSGVISSNPAIPLSAAITGVIDVSALGKLTLALTGSLAYTLVGEHIETVKIEVKVTGTGTLRAYALLKPTFSVEKAKGADPQFRMKANFKIAAGLFLGLEGSIEPSIFGKGPKFETKKYEWALGSVGMSSDLDYLLGSAAGPALKFDKYKFKGDEFNDKAEELLNDSSRAYDKKDQQKGKRVDQTTRAPTPPKGAPKTVYFWMDGVRHELWIENDPLPTLYMASGRGKPFKKKVRAQAEALKKEEDAAAGGQKALIRAEETAVEALMKHAVDVESSAESLEERQADVAGLQELARQIEIYAKQFTKTDIGDRTDDMDSKKAKLLDQEGLVGSFRALIAAGSKNDDVTPHHMPQDKYMESKLKGNPGGESYDRKDGICINMYHPTKTPKKGRHFFTRSYGSYGNPPRYKETPMEALQKDIANVRAVYEKDNLLTSRIKDALALLHALNVKNYPKLFRGGP